MTRLAFSLAIATLSFSLVVSCGKSNEGEEAAAGGGAGGFGLLPETVAGSWHGYMTADGSSILKVGAEFTDAQFKIWDSAAKEASYVEGTYEAYLGNYALLTFAKATIPVLTSEKLVEAKFSMSSGDLSLDTNKWALRLKRDGAPPSSAGDASAATPLKDHGAVGTWSCQDPGGVSWSFQIYTAGNFHADVLAGGQQTGWISGTASKISEDKNAVLNLTATNAAPALDASNLVFTGTLADAVTLMLVSNQRTLSDGTVVQPQTLRCQK